MRDENGVRLTILEQCRILKLSRATYYECCKFEAERQKKESEEKLIRNLYKELGIKGQKPVFKTTRSGKAPYGKFPYLLRNKFIELLKSYNVEISMDGIGRCKGNIFVERTWRTLKYEWIFLRDYRSEEELRKLLGDFVKFFNNERIHQGLDYKTPDEVYKEGSFPSAIIKKMAAA